MQVFLGMFVNTAVWTCVMLAKRWELRVGYSIPRPAVWVFGICAKLAGSLELGIQYPATLEYSAGWALVIQKYQATFERSIGWVTLNAL